VIDTHAHLDACAEPADELVARALEAGVDRIVSVGSGLDSCRETLAIAGRHDAVFAALGVHPHQASEPDATRLDELRELLADERAVAVGETGLDFYRDRSDPEHQRRAFSAQIEIARRTGKALVIHLRDRDGSEEAFSEAFGTLEQEAEGVEIILHCFSAGPRWAERAGELGWYCSFAGNLTYPKAEPIREATALVPDNRLLVETDSPFLSPQPMRGKPNQPANVVATAERLAEVRGVTYGELERTVEANAARVFGW
jgi:TatD DNase family protein